MKRKLLFAMLCIVSVLGLRAQTWTASNLSAGKYVFKNVGANLYMGPGNSWGTRASLIEGSHFNTLSVISEGVYKIESQVSNGGTQYYLGVNNAGDLYLDNSGSNITIKDNGAGIYTMQARDEETFIGYDGTNTYLVHSLTDATSENAQWQIVACDDVYEGATEENPADVTFNILAPNVDRNHRSIDAWTAVASNYTKQGGGDQEYYVSESWQSTFTVSQTCTVPNGYYRIRCQGFVREYSETGADYPVVFVNDATSPFVKMVTTTASLSDVKNYFKNKTDGGYYTEWSDVTTVTDKSITVGVKGTRTNTWAVWRNLQLQYLGPIDLTEFQTGLANAVAAAEATEGTIPTACYDAIAAVVTENNKEYETSDEYSDAIIAINTAVSTNASSAIVAAYSDYLAVRTAVLAINDGIDVSAADALANAGTNETYATACTNASVSVRSALSNYIQDNEVENVDLTDAVLVNSSFEDGFTGWTNNGMATQTNTSFEKVGNVYCEKWQPDGTFGVSQVFTALVSGVYRLSAKSKARGVTSAKLYAGGVDKAITVGDATDTYSVEFAADADAEITFGFEGIGTGAGSSWLCVDNFTLTFVGALPDVTAATGKMNAEVSAAQAAAISTYNSNKTVANYNAAQTAISNAEASIAAYATAAAAVTKANAIKDAHNFASSSATETFAEAIAAISDAYDDGSLIDSDASAAGTTLGTVVTGWHGNNNAAAVAYLRDGFSLGDFAADPALHVNTWSTEGDNDGSGFSVPFYESWTADANSLPESTITGTLTALPNGLYSISAWVRVRAKNETEATDATGITMDVNGGGEGAYAAVDVTEGEQVGSTQFQIGTYTAQGLVKDGSLTLNFNIADNANISWLSFQNVSYTKVRDLTAEEMAVVPADLSVEAAKTVFKGKSVALATPTSTTEDASITGFVTYESDNPSVATVDASGVVTGVAYGTANITVTSTLNAEATATCAVTVTAPTYDQLENLDFAEGPAISNHIRTYARDITGTDVAQMQNVEGWSFGVTNGDARAAGVMAYGSSYGMGSNSSDFYAPATNPDGEVTGNVLGMVGVWDANVKYVQNVKFSKGAYVITIPVYRNGGATALDKNLIGVVLDNGTEYLAETKTYTASTWTTETIRFTITEDNTYGQLSLGLDAPNKGSADSQRLWIDGVTITYEPFATDSEIAALNDAIDAAENHALGFDDGEYAPYKNVSALTTLAAAKALDTENPIVQSAVTSATSALTSATWTANSEEVNAVYDGAFAAATNDGAPAGWTMSNNTLGGDYHSRAFVGDDRLSEFNGTKSGLFLRFDGTNSSRGSMYYYGNTAGYTMPLKKDVTYYVKVDFAGWGSTGKPLRMNITGPEGFESQSQQYNTSVRADNADDTPQQFLIVFTASVAGNYVINFQTPGADSNTHNVVISNVEVFRATPANMTITDAQYATFVAPFDVTIPEDVTAYTVDGTTGAALNMTEMTTTIPANTPVVLYKESALATTTFYGRPVDGEPTEGLLTGVYASTTATAGTYVLQNNDGKVGFYKVESGEEPTIGANRAYLTKSGAGDVKAFFFNNTDAIKSVFDGVSAGDIYDLAGRKVSRMQKGNAYIVNGKKVVIK